MPRIATRREKRDDERGGERRPSCEDAARFGRRGDADLQRIDPDRLGDVLELGLTEIGDGEIEPALDLPIGLLGKTDSAGFSDAFEARGDVDAVAHQIAVALLDDVAEMNADAEFDALVRRDAG